MRPSDLFLVLAGSGIAVFATLLGLHAPHSRTAAEGGHRVRLGLVRELRLTDLCLFTEARYTRHPAMADLHAPFQDHPGALEHFPSGALLPPPSFLRNHDQHP